MERDKIFASICDLLNTPAGEMLVEETGKSWDAPNPLDPDAATMGYNIGLQQCHRQLMTWKNYKRRDV